MASPYDYIFDESSMVCTKEDDDTDNCTVTVTCNECRTAKTTIVFKRAMESVNGARVPRGGLAYGDNIPLSVYYSHQVPGNGWMVHQHGIYCPPCRKNLGYGPYYTVEKMRE
jgi:hypothetical protein